MGDNEEGTMTTAYVLERTLTVLFGHKTVPVRMFRGKGCRDPRIPASFFATDRLKNHPDKPINRLAAERVVELVQICLAGESAYDRLSVSRLVSGLAHEFSGVGCDALIIESLGDAQIEEKVAAQLDLVRAVMACAVGKHLVERARIMGLIVPIAARAERWGGREAAERLKEACGCGGGCSCPWRANAAALKVAERRLEIPEKPLVKPDAPRVKVSLSPINEGKVLLMKKTMESDEAEPIREDRGGPAWGHVEARGVDLASVFKWTAGKRVWVEPEDGGFNVWYEELGEGR